MKVLLVHDWLNGMRGGEKVLELFCELFPNAPIYSLHGELDEISNTIKNHKVSFSLINRLPGKKKYYRHYLPLYPFAVSKWDTSGYDLVISTSHCAVKNMSISPGTKHLCYCFSPMRYVWALQEDYFGKGLKKKFLKPFFYGLKKWDFNGSKRVHHFIAVSRTIKQRIKECYKRDSTVIYPPIDFPFFPNTKKKDYFLVLSALTPYKRIDLAIEASRRLKVPLVVAGSGPLLSFYQKNRHPYVEFLGWVDQEKKVQLLKNARALLFPGLEDFGIVPLEAMAFATPVIAFGRGGVTETVTQGKTGLFFSSQTVEDLISCMKMFEEQSFIVGDFEETIKLFSKEVFFTRIREIIPKVINGELFE